MQNLLARCRLPVKQPSNNIAAPALLAQFCLLVGFDRVSIISAETFVRDKVAAVGRVPPDKPLRIRSTVFGSSGPTPLVVTLAKARVQPVFQCTDSNVFNSSGFVLQFKGLYNLVADSVL